MWNVNHSHQKMQENQKLQHKHKIGEKLTSWLPESKLKEGRDVTIKGEEDKIGARKQETTLWRVTRLSAMAMVGSGMKWGIANIRRNWAVTQRGSDRPVTQPREKKILLEIPAAPGMFDLNQFNGFDHPYQFHLIAFFSCLCFMEYFAHTSWY